MRIAILGITLSVLAQAAMAQSVLTLDDFDLGDDLAEVKPAPTSEMEDCLLNNADCVNREYKSGSDLSLDDVVNLGIVDHESVPTTVSTEGAVASVPVSKTAPLPSIDIEILFDYNSDQVRPDQYAKLSELSNVLHESKFDGYRFVFLGHTDAKGGDAYNLDLSTRRAESVAQLVRSFAGLSFDRTIASGMGFTRLKDSSDPFGAQNRRVQLLLVPR